MANILLSYSTATKGIIINMYVMEVTVQSAVFY